MANFCDEERPIIDMAGLRESVLDKKLSIAEAALMTIRDTRELAKELDAEWCVAATGMVRIAKEALLKLEK